MVSLGGKLMADLSSLGAVKTSAHVLQMGGIFVDKLKRILFYSLLRTLMYRFI